MFRYHFTALFSNRMNAWQNEAWIKVSPLSPRFSAAAAVYIYSMLCTQLIQSENYTLEVVCYVPNSILTAHAFDSHALRILRFDHCRTKWAKGICSHAAFMDMRWAQFGEIKLILSRVNILFKFYHSQFVIAGATQQFSPFFPSKICFFTKLVWSTKNQL